MIESRNGVLPLGSPAAQAAAAVALAVLMICTRGQHFASVNALPSASWAVFFLAGALLRPMWALPAFFVLSSALDIGSLAAGTITDWCVSPAYWALAFAYAALWLGGNFHARRWHEARGQAVPQQVAALAVALLASGTVAYVFSKGGFYFFSGHYPRADLAGFLARVPHYYPRALGTMAGYVGAALVLVALCRRLAQRRAGEVLA